MAEEPPDIQNTEPAEGEATPVCLRCLTPVHPLQNYCHNCHETVGQLAPYIPFVNIPYNYGIFGTMWKRIWGGRDTAWYRKVFYLFLILVFAPLMFIGILFAPWARFRRKSETPQPDNRESSH